MRSGHRLEAAKCEVVDVRRQNGRGAIQYGQQVIQNIVGFSDADAIPGQIDCSCTHLISTVKTQAWQRSRLGDKIYLEWDSFVGGPVRDRGWTFLADRLSGSWCGQAPALPVEQRIVNE